MIKQSWQNVSWWYTLTLVGSYLIFVMWFKKAFSQRKATSEITTNARGMRATETIKQGYNFSANEFVWQSVSWPSQTNFGNKIPAFPCYSLTRVTLLLQVIEWKKNQNKPQTISAKVCTHLFSIIIHELAVRGKKFSTIFREALHSNVDLIHSVTELLLKHKPSKKLWTKT